MCYGGHGKGLLQLLSFDIRGPPQHFELPPKDHLQPWLAWYLSNQFLGAWPRLDIHRASSTEGTPLKAGGVGGTAPRSFTASPRPDQKVKKTFQPSHQNSRHQLKNAVDDFLLPKSQLDLFGGSQRKTNQCSVSAAYSHKHRPILLQSDEHAKHAPQTLPSVSDHTIEDV